MISVLLALAAEGLDELDKSVFNIGVVNAGLTYLAWAGNPRHRQMANDKVSL